MKVAIIGASGQLGTDICQALKGFEVLPLTHADIEITDMSSTKRILRQHMPDIIVNTAAFLRVDDCETEIDRAFAVNALGTRNVAVVAYELASKLLHISTDYIFGVLPEKDAPRTKPYTEFDSPAPPNIYGRSKLAGENFVRHLCPRHFIVRTSGLFGVTGSISKGGNFVETMLKLGREQDQLKVVNDQVFSPTYTKDLASKIAEIIVTDCFGVFHITNRGACSWYEFAREILGLAGLKTPLIPISSDLYPQEAKRPRFSVLDNYQLRLLGMDDMRSWQEALADYMKGKGYVQTPKNCNFRGDFFPLKDEQ